MAASSGRPNAAVLPVPVWATPTMSRPLSRAGTACAWMAEGVVKPRSAIAAWSAGGRPSSSKVPFSGMAEGATELMKRGNRSSRGGALNRAPGRRTAGRSPGPPSGNRSRGCLDHTTRGGPRPAQRWWRRLEGGRDELQIHRGVYRADVSRGGSARVTSRTTPSQTAARTLDRRAGIHHDVEARGTRALGGRLVHDAELE